MASPGKQNAEVSNDNILRFNSGFRFLFSDFPRLRLPPFSVSRAHRRRTAFWGRRVGRV